MVNVNKIRGLLAENEMSQNDLAALLACNPKTLYFKMKKGVFRSDEIEIIIKRFNIKDPTDVVTIFFPDLIS